MRAMAAILAAHLILSAAAQEKIDVNGTWELTIESPQGKFNPVMALKAEAGKLTGTIKGRLGEFPLTGTISGNQIKFSYAASLQGQELTLTFSGTVEKDSMKGSVDFGGFGSGNWSARRPADRATDISGAWVFTVETDQGTGSPEFTFKQEGQKLTGTYRGMFGEAPVEGKVAGNEVEFSFKVSAQGLEGTITYSGTIEGDAMKGTVKLGDFGSGTWTAKRKQ